jgi:hypothetical protein
LKEKAVRSYTQYCSTHRPAPIQPQSLSFPSSSDADATDGVEKELAIFGGQTRVLARKSKAKSPGSGGSDASLSPTTSAGGFASETTQVMTTMSTTDVHPSLLEYLGSRSSLGCDAAQPADPLNGHGEALAGLSLQQVISGTSTSEGSSASNPPGKQMGEMFSSFMGYLVNRSISNANVSLPAPGQIPDSYSSGQQNTRQEWDCTVEGSTSSLSQAEECLGWPPPFNGEPRSQFLNPSITMITSNTLLPSTSSVFPNNQLTDFIPISSTVTQPYSNYEPYVGFPGNTQYPPAMTDPGPAGTMVELGLMTESEIDSGWFSFMQDCGISMDSPPVEDQRISSTMPVR